MGDSAIAAVLGGGRLGVRHMTAALLEMPGARVSIAALRCDECGGAPMIFVPAAWPRPRIFAFCGPACAAGCGVEPWASADRVGWMDRGEMERAA